MNTSGAVKTIKPVRDDGNARGVENRTIKAGPRNDRDKPLGVVDRSKQRQSLESSLKGLSPSRSDAQVAAKGHVVDAQHTPVRIGKNDQLRKPPGYDEKDRGDTDEHRQGTPSLLNETSVLANKFVPGNVLAINLLPVTAPMEATKLPTFDENAKAIAVRTVPLTPCLCTSERHHDIRTANVASTERIKPELRYGLMASVGSNNFANEEKREERYLQTLTQNNDVSRSPQAYATIFRALLGIERQKVLRLYENFSLYGVQMTILGKGPAPLHAQIDIPGIADAQPGLRRGDIVLVRPVSPCNFPAYGSPRSYPRYDSHIVEVQAQVSSIVRSTSKKRKDHVIITWLTPNEDEALRFSGPHASTGYNIRFIPSTARYERCVTALSWVSSLPVTSVSGVLFPTTAPLVPITPTEDVTLISPSTQTKAGDGDSTDLVHKLNEKQTAFVDMVRSRTANPATDKMRAPMILTGPAGTGKTGTLLTALTKVLAMDADRGYSRKHRILVCTPSHTAADVITTRLAATLSRQELFRLYDTSHAVASVPLGVLPFTRQSSDDTGAFVLPPPKELLSFRVLVCTCVDAHLLYQAGITNASLRTRRRCFKTYVEHSIVESMLSISGEISGEDDPHWSHLFLDEATQATEPESLIPLSCVIDPRPGGCKTEMAMVGDPRQLGPRVYSSVAAHGGLNMALVERLLKRKVKCLGGGHKDMLGPPHVNNIEMTMDDLLQHYTEEKAGRPLSVFLTENYRGHPSFLMMPSAMFYFDKLQSAKGSVYKTGESPEEGWCKKLRTVESLSTLAEIGACPPADTTPATEIFKVCKQVTWPIHFRGVIGKDTSVAPEFFAGTDSWSNKPEANAVVEIVSALCRVGVCTESIGVMAPFRGQVVLIRKLLRAVKLGGVNVGTVEDYQAVQRDVIVLSLTRSSSAFIKHDALQRLGVFRQPKRTNVALTRAENLFVVVGNPATMAEDPIWRQWLLFCHRNKLWYGAGARLHELDGARLEYSTSLPDVAVTDDADKDHTVTVSTLERISRRYKPKDKVYL